MLETMIEEQHWEDHHRSSIIDVRAVIGTCLVECVLSRARKHPSLPCHRSLLMKWMKGRCLCCVRVEQRGRHVFYGVCGYGYLYIILRYTALNIWLIKLRTVNCHKEHPRGPWVCQLLVACSNLFGSLRDSACVCFCFVVSTFGSLRDYVMFTF
jgi:hypothetical protein